MSIGQPDPPEPPVSPELPGGDIAERRVAQRFFALRRGRPCFWLGSGEPKLPLHDLSLQGFSCVVPLPPAIGAVFDFTLTRHGVPDRICGQAEVKNYLQDSQQVGCRFVSLAADGSERLQDWLIAHVLMNASVPISEQDAERIVSGGSLV